eukprot:410907-Alexandrium_andersonii.AAC.1
MLLGVRWAGHRPDTSWWRPPPGFASGPGPGQLGTPESVLRESRNRVKRSAAGLGSSRIGLEGPHTVASHDP